MQVRTKSACVMLGCVQRVDQWERSAQPRDSAGDVCGVRRGYVVLPALHQRGSHSIHAAAGCDETLACALRS